MILGLRTNSATWLYRFCIKSSVMNTWYLVSLATHLKWPGFLENFLASCRLQQFRVKSVMNTRELIWLNLWQATLKYSQNWNLVCSSHVSVDSKIERSFITELKEKSYCYSVSMARWHWYRDYIFFKTVTFEVLAKKTVHLHWQNTNVNRRLLIDFF